MSNKTFVFESDSPNDKIDIYGDIDTVLKKLQVKNNKHFRMQIEGKNIDVSVVNAIRRSILMYIPIYGFHRSNIRIDVERSRHMYNNDLIYNLIETLPIFDIPNYFDLENPETYLPTEVMRNLFGTFIQERFGDDMVDDASTASEDANKKLFRIDLSINVKNNTGIDKFVTTHDAVLKVEGKISNSYMSRKPISILVLKPNEEIYLSAEANLGISKMHAIYEATTNAIHKEITPMKFELEYETLEQLDKNVIFTKACIILMKKMESLKDFIQKKYSEERDPSEIIEIQLFGEEHTLGNLLATILQKCEHVAKAGYDKPHPFIDQIIIAYKLSSKSKVGPIKVFVDVIDYLVRLFQQIAHVAFKKDNNK